MTWTDQPEAERPPARHVDEASEETWDDPVRGHISFRTLFSREITGTRVLTTGMAELPEGGRLGLHRHSASEVYYVLGGRGHVSLDGAEIEVSRGSAVHIAGGAWHGIRNAEEVPLRLLYTLAADGMEDVAYDFAEGGTEHS